MKPLSCGGKKQVRGHQRAQTGKRFDDGITNLSDVERISTQLQGLAFVALRHPFDPRKSSDYVFHELQYFLTGGTRGSARTSLGVLSVTRQHYF